MATDYNGWTNWETWNANVWLTNEPSTDEMAREAAQQGKDELREFVENLIWGFGETPAAGIGTDFILAGLSAINWDELTEWFTNDD